MQADYRFRPFSVSREMCREILGPFVLRYIACLVSRNVATALFDILSTYDDRYRQKYWQTLQLLLTQAMRKKGFYDK